MRNPTRAWCALLLPVFTMMSAGIARSQPADPSQVGQWSPPFNLPLVPIHTSLLTNGTVLIYDSNTGAATPPRIFDPATLSTTAVPYGGQGNLFCSGHVPLTDGRIFAAGGDAGGYVGIQVAAVFDPSTSAWTEAAPMAYARWYPTLTKLPDGRVLVVSGAVECYDCVDPTASHLGIADIPEIFDPRDGTWQSLLGSSLRLPLYPHLYVLPDGRVFAAATQEDPIVSQVLDLTTGAWSAVDPGHLFDGGSSVMYLPGKVMKSGTARNPDYPVAGAAATTYVIDMTQPSPAWRQTASMAFPRTQHNLLSLPDGKVLAIGGGRNSDVVDLGSAVLQAELWDPSTESWGTLASCAVPRLYHSVALLLPDGRVFVGGGGHPPGFGIPQFAAEIYSPPYLFKGPRPVVADSPGVVEHGENFFVATPDAASVTAVNLVAQGSVTHAFNMNARFLTLPFTPTAGGLSVLAPANANVAPPGQYMMFLVNGNGVPSVAAWLRIPAAGEDADPPTAPASLVASASTGAVDLSWSAAADNVGVTAYDVHRSQAPGFAPSQSNRVGVAAGTAYRDAPVPGGAHWYRVRARDAAGNVGPASSEAAVTVVADTTPPSAPSSLAVTVTGPGYVGLTWNASTDDVGVSGYFVERCAGPACGSFEEVERTAATTIHDAGLLASTVYRYRVRAGDPQGNRSAYSGAAEATTAARGSGPVAAWAFDEGAGIEARDVSGLANDGTLGGAAWTEQGKFGRGLAFDGGSALVTVAPSASLDLTSAMTLSAWVHPRIAQSGWSTVLHKNVDRYYLMAYSASGAPVGGGTFGSGNQNAFGADALAPGAWTHLAVVFDGSSVRLYADGTEVSASQQTAPLAISSESLQIGGSAYGEFFDGILDEIRVYDRALTADEIRDDMNSPVLAGSVQIEVGKGAGGGTVDLAWTDSASSGTYRVRRASGPTPSDLAAAACFVAQGTTFTDPAPPADGVSRYYVVDAKASCP